MKRIIIVTCMLVFGFVVPSLSAQKMGTEAKASFACEDVLRRQCHQAGGLWNIACCTCSMPEDMALCSDMGGIWNSCTTSCSVWEAGTR